MILTKNIALKIFRNPKDLVFSIGRDKKSKKYCYAITRGPGHNGKVLLSGEEIPYRETVLDLTQIILETVIRCGLENFPTGRKAKECLTESQKENILKILKRRNTCSTCIWIC